LLNKEGKGKQGMEIIDSITKVEDMLALYEAEQCVNIIVLEKFFVWPTGLNVEADIAEVHNVPVKYGVNAYHMMKR
jgi:hypothetical protein